MVSRYLLIKSHEIYRTFLPVEQNECLSIYCCVHENACRYPHTKLQLPSRNVTGTFKPVQSISEERAMIARLPDDVIRHIMTMCTCREIVKLMMVNSRLRCIGKECEVWRNRCKLYKLPDPARRATRYKTHYNIFMKTACRNCFSSQRVHYGFCTRCVLNTRAICMLVGTMNDARSKQRTYRRKIQRLQTSIEWHMADLERMNELKERTQTALCSMGQLQSVKSTRE